MVEAFAEGHCFGPGELQLPGQNAAVCAAVESEPQDNPLSIPKAVSIGDGLIEEPRVEDAGPLAMLAARTFRAAYQSVLGEADLACYEQEAFSEARVRSEIADPHVRLRVVRCGDALCGYSKLEETPAPAEIRSARPIELVRLYVEGTSQGRGYGRLLIEDALERAGHNTACWLRVWVRNRRAIDLYRRCGFEVVGEEPYEVGRARETVLLMLRETGR